MPYTKEHKQRTRERILREAARAFREEGVDGVAIPQVMNRAGLTHGGFYAHFASKDALVTAACGTGFDEVGLELIDRVASVAPGHEVRQIIRAYLSRAHRDDPGSGCMLPSMTAEIARGSPEVRAGFTAALKRYAHKLAGYFPPDDPRSPEQRETAALLLLTGMAGVLQVSRALDDRDLSDHILLAARAFYTATFARDTVPSTAANAEDPNTEHRSPTDDHTPRA